jgi:hypothetical protein
MVLKQNLSASEGTFSILDKIQTVERLFPEKSAETRRKIHFLPNEIIKEMSEFTKRNALIVFASCLDGKEPCYKCCDKCLKAHTMKKCKELELGKKICELVNEVFPCEAGHDGHYIDEENLVSLR